MDKTEIIRLLELYSKGELKQEETAEKLSTLGLEEMGFATLDTDRHGRTGIPEVIYSEGKTAQQLADIAGRMHKRGIPILATRATREKYEAVLKQVPGAIYHEMARCIEYRPEASAPSERYIAVVSAGTSDMPVSEEAAITAEFLGSRVERIYDVGVAGIHRLFNRMDLIRTASVVIVVAGMEGALASVVGGMVDKPVIGVPCSAGYGANFGGVSALLAMLNSCAAGVSVVNIDNGFGAACQAHLIARQNGSDE
jgi:NCAIR mutase (PurE)-related protein